MTISNSVWIYFFRPLSLVLLFQNPASGVILPSQWVILHLTDMKLFIVMILLTT